MRKLLRDTRNVVENRERIAVLRLELNYYLMTLYDAMKTEDRLLQNETKAKLENIRAELMNLQAL
jgi:ABC-type phosphate transport system ATPase subunit